MDVRSVISQKCINSYVSYMKAKMIILFCSIIGYGSIMAQNFHQLNFDFSGYHGLVDLVFLDESQLAALTPLIVSQDVRGRYTLNRLQDGRVLLRKRLYRYLEGEVTYSFLMKNRIEADLYFKYCLFIRKRNFQIITFRISPEEVQFLLSEFESKRYIFEDIGLIYVLEDGRVFVYEKGIEGILYNSINDISVIYNLDSYLEGKDFIERMKQAF